MTKQEAIEILEKHKSFYEGKVFTPFQAKDIICAYDVLIAESKNPIDFNKLRDEFFAECTITEAIIGHWNVYTKSAINLAPHDIFEWFKNKLNG